MFVLKNFKPWPISTGYLTSLTPTLLVLHFICIITFNAYSYIRLPLQQMQPFDNGPFWEMKHVIDLIYTRYFPRYKVFFVSDIEVKIVCGKMVKTENNICANKRE